MQYEAQITKLIEKSATAHGPTEAMQFAQAALNVANTIATLAHAELTSRQ